MNRSCAYRSAAVVGLFAIAPAVPGCPFSNPAGQDDEAKDAATFATEMNVTTSSPASSGKIRIVFRNLTDTYGVDVQFYATGNAVVDPDTDLFIPANHVTGPQDDPIGVFGTGIIPPMTEDSVELSCAQARVIGTLGGRFVTQDTGAEVGTGTRRIAVQEQQFNCGETIIFDFLSQ